MLQGFVVLHKKVLDTTKNISNISDFVLYHKLFQLVSRNSCYKLHFLFNSEGWGGGFPASPCFTVGQHTRVFT